MLENFFETNNLMKNIEFIHEEASKERKYFKKFMSELLSLGLDIELINKIIENLSVEKNALYEKINILEFYRKLKNKNIGDKNIEKIEVEIEK